MLESVWGLETCCNLAAPAIYSVMLTFPTKKASYYSLHLRLPKTPAVRVPRHKERVYSISVNGSPIAAGNEDIVISVPVGNGEVSAHLVRLRASGTIDQSVV